MPSYTRGQPRDKLTFALVSSPNLYYGWSTKDLASIPGAGISSGDLLTLGHLEPNSVPNVGIKIIAANSPKPPRIKKTINNNPSASQQGDVSTYCGIQAISDAEGIGWKLSKSGRSVTITNNQRTVTVAAELENGGLYLFPMNLTDANAYASTLGLQMPNQISANERRNAFTGTSRPKPARVKLPLNDGGSVNSFCATNALDNALSNGWQLIKPEIVY